MGLIMMSLISAKLGEFMVSERLALKIHNVAVLSGNAFVRTEKLGERRKMKVLVIVHDMHVGEKIGSLSG